MDEFDNLDLFLKDFEEDLVRIGDGKLSNEIKEVYHEESEYMYTEYDNKETNRYQLGLTGAYGDENMIEVDINLNKNGISIEARNDALARGKDKGDYLDYYIEEGIYEYSASEVGKREVSERVIDRLESEQLIENILKSELKKKGYDLI